jgi:hypothetical protein
MSSNAGICGLAGRCVALLAAALLAVCVLPEVSVAQSTGLPSAIESFSFQTLDQAGTTYTQAGGHPYALSTTIMLESEEVNGHRGPKGTLKDLVSELPAGLIGDPAATPRCALRNAEEARCSAASQIGFLSVYHASVPEIVPVFNVVPPEGVAARFVAEINGSADAFIDSGVRTGEGYGVTAGAHQITELGKAYGVTLVLWGVPGEASHDKERRCSTPYGEGYHYVLCEEAGETPASLSQTPLLSEPTSCSGRELTVKALADFYQEPDEYSLASTTMPAVTGCSKVSFEPTISVTPQTSSSDSPTGVQVVVKVPQDESAEGLATASLRDAIVTLPAGVGVNPAEASGVDGCPLLIGKEARVGQVGIDLENSEAANCPQASKIGSVELETPLIEHVLPGAVYLAQQGNAGAAQQGSNPFGSLLALYIVVDDPVSGVVVKLAGKVEARAMTGQLTATFDENPQLPFEELRVDFYGGQRSALSTPIDCGTYTAASLLEPWAHEAADETGTADAEPTGSFEITSLAGGAACGTPPFAPTLTAGTTDNDAAAYTPLTTLIKRTDGEQTLKSVSVTLPKGVAGVIANVPRCGEAEADAGTCSAASQIGDVQVQAGVGTEPLTLPEAGKREDPVYLTGPFEGAPFGLSIVVHPEAGPFNLAEGAGTASEKPIVVRAKIEVNPHTAQVTVATPATGPYSTPTIIQGIPVDIQSILVNVDREDFIFNATSCEPMSATGAFGSAEGASATASSRYQASECSKLEFKPKLTATTKAKNSRKAGASLNVKVRYAKSGEANLGRVKVELPEALPADDATLKYACPEAQFASDPAGCPEGAMVGSAKAVTPVLKSPLTGPVYFVSHAAAKFPELVAVLQGEGITIDLAGETFISKKGVISSTFATIPDQPVTSFEMSLPEGKYPVVTAQGKDLCDDKLAMPTQLTGQNGAFIEQKTSIKVEGCSSKVSFAGHKVKGRNAKVTVYVPTAGKVAISGKGIKGKTKKAAGRGTVGFELRQKKAGKLHTTVTVKFKPSKGKKQTKKLKLKFKK